MCWHIFIHAYASNNANLEQFTLKGNVASAYSEMSPVVAKFCKFTTFDSLRKHMMEVGIVGAKDLSYRTLALCYCEMQTLLWALGFTPPPSQVASLSDIKLVSIFTGLRMRLALEAIRRASPIESKHWSSIE